ncbi:MAG: response regulator [Planctomycetota bacterium]|nr:MAG: response regulator [Planctomycetota bacterium]
MVDDQPIIGEAVRRMFLGVDGIAFHYCRDPAAALAMASEIEPTVVLLDLVMPGIDGLELLRRFRHEERFHDLPIIVLSTKEEAAVKAEAFSLGASDYLVKLPDRVEMLARVRHHSRGHTALRERNEAFEALRASRQVLANDLASAAQYVRSLLPPPAVLPGVKIDWRFIPSADLGGDAFGYHLLDEDHVAIYLLDVCGHGVGAALLSVSALNAVRSETLPNVDFHAPGAVLAALNRAFRMERQNDMFFTIWYGVYEISSRRLRWSGGGHPPALLLTGPTATGSHGGNANPQPTTALALESDGPLIGAVEGIAFETHDIAVPPRSTLYVFSDGAFEIGLKDGSMWTLSEFRTLLETPTPGGSQLLDTLVGHARQISSHQDFQDDFSIVEIEFS